MAYDFSVTNIINAPIQVAVGSQVNLKWEPEVDKTVPSTYTFAVDMLTGGIYKEVVNGLTAPNAIVAVQGVTSGGVTRFRVRAYDNGASLGSIETNDITVVPMIVKLNAPAIAYKGHSYNINWVKFAVPAYTMVRNYQPTAILSGAVPAFTGYKATPVISHDLKFYDGIETIHIEYADDLVVGINHTIPTSVIETGNAKYILETLVDSVKVESLDSNVVAVTVMNDPSIRIKRGPEAKIPTEEALGELMYATDTHTIWVGNGPGVPCTKIGISEWEDLENIPTTLAGFGITDAVAIGEVVEIATANKLLRLNAEGKLPADITGDAATVGGISPLNITTGGVRIWTQDTQPNDADCKVNDLWIAPSTKRTSIYLANGTWGPASESAVTREQKTKFGIVATSATPVVVDFTVPTDPLMTRVPSVLKLVSSDNNVVQTICNFDNADATSFVVPEGGDVVFDGKMKLVASKTVTKAMTAQGAIGDGYLFSLDIDLSEFNSVSSIELV